MSFRETHARGNRASVLVTVAVIHVVGIYALVNGLGNVLVTVIRDGHLPTRDYRPDVVVPLDPPRPQKDRRVLPRPHTAPTGQTVVTVDTTLKTDTGFTLPPFDPPAGPGDDAGIRPQPTPTVTPRAAVPANSPGAWASDADYPPADLHAGHAGTTRFALAIAPDGSVTGCTVTTGSGWPGLDAATCRAVLKRARFRPASDETGAHVAGTYASAIRWVIPQ